MGCLMVSHGSTTEYKRNWNREAYYSQVLEEVHSIPQGAKGEVKAVCREAGSGAHASIKVRGWSALGFPG